MDGSYGCEAILLLWRRSNLTTLSSVLPTLTSLSKALCYPSQFIGAL